jgi:4-hydroxy-tetrahydrodipicolinate synthase
MSAPDWLRGSATPVITPFRDGAVDYEAFEALVDRQAQASSDAVVVTGTTGEPTSLSPQERLELVRRAVAAGGGLPVIAATGSANHAETLELTRAAAAAGADAVLVVCPAFAKPSDDGMVEHFAAVAAAVDVPLLIYNIPGRAAVSISAAAVERIAERAPNLVGLKHASPDLDLVTELLLSLGDDFRIFCGLESYTYPMLALGGAGVMSAVGNLFPERVTALCRAVAEGDHAAALALHRQLYRVNKAIFLETNPVPLKQMLEQLGIARGEVRLPLAPASEATRAALGAVLAEYGHASPAAR